MSNYVPGVVDHPHRSTFGVTLADSYNQAFMGVVADTPELKRKAFRLRFQAYCLEHDYEDPAINPGGLEQDQYDEHSVHALLLQRATGQAIGTIRLVCTKPGTRRECLPFHEVCKKHRFVLPDFLSHGSVAEVSRLAISKARREQAEKSARMISGLCHAPRTAQKARPTPYTALGLLRMAVELAASRGVRYFCAIMEPSLLRMLRACGIYFEPIGTLVQYHGWRQPCFAHIPTLLDGIEVHRPDIWEVITDYGRLRTICDGGAAPARLRRPMLLHAAAG